MKNFLRITLILSFMLFLFFIFTKSSSIALYNNLDKERDIKILFIGDIMMDRNVEKKLKILNKNYYTLFEKINNYLKSFDYVVANIEGPVATSGIKVGSKYSFRMKPEVLQALKDANINILNIANNHIFDYGRRAFSDTLKNIKASGLYYYGDSYQPLIIEKDGIRIGFLGFSDFLKHLKADENKIGIAVIDKNLEEHIKKAKEKVDILFVTFHWGDEYKKEANERQKRLARLAIDSGADLVIGHHPHIIQNIEKYKSKYIFYSLGNFIFDQDFSKETMIGGGVEVYLKVKQKPHGSNTDLNGLNTNRNKPNIDQTLIYTGRNIESKQSVLSPNQSVYIEKIYFRKFYLNKNYQIEKISEPLVLYEIEGKVYLLREAKNREEWERGLMFVKKPFRTQIVSDLTQTEQNKTHDKQNYVDYDGMIFIFPDKQIRSFWNKNTFVDLDVYWLDDDKIIGKETLESINKTKNIKIITSPIPVNKVVEIIK